MASVIGEAVVGKFFEMAVEMAVQKLAEEVKLEVNFRKDFIWLNKELNYVWGFLQDADQQSRHSEDVKQWLEDIRVIALNAEVIFEECAVESMYGNDAQSCGLSCRQWILRYKIRRKIKDIKDRITSINQKGEQLKLAHGVVFADEALPSTSRSVDRRRSSLLPSDSHPVGIQHKVDYMLSLLDNPALPVIAVVGMGGAGKSYLLQHVYNNIRERYEKSIWLSVSQSYSIGNLQKDLVFQLDESLSKRIRESGVSEQQAAQSIHEELQKMIRESGKMCLVVLDDVWRASREDDLLSKLGLPTGMNSPCKIVVTTRSKDVCKNLDAKIYEMQYLSKEESWDLFSFYAFRGYEGNRVADQQLEKVGREIVEQCGNLPLAIKTTAASLANTTIPWELKLSELKGVVTANVDRDPIMPLLRLSYDSLPACLKACFAYLSFFPEDEEIKCEDLINMWIGEGFIPAREGQWDVAWDCLYQLANLCLLQLWEELTDDYLLEKKLTKYCKIHDLLLDLAIHISRENKCAFSIEEASTHTSGGTGCCRILLAKKDIDDYAISGIRPVCLRTLSLSQNDEITSIPVNLFTAMRGLHVLDLSSTEISTLPASVGKMKLLKVLNLRGTRIMEVPECVRHLKSLLFLALPDWYGKSLPVWISELDLECPQIDRMPKGISKLASLRTLRSRLLYFSIEDDEFMRLEDLPNMTQLQEVGLILKDEMELKRMEEGILAQLVKMRHLSICDKNDREVAHCPENMTPMKHLESLILERFAVPSWICELANLRELILYDCECSDYPELQRMPNLVSLYLYGNDRCRELPKAFGKSGGFPHLHFFTIQSFYELEEFPELEEGALACLKELVLHSCFKVKKVGEGLERLKRLKVFEYIDRGVRNECWEALKEGGEYWNKIKAINPEVKLIIRQD